MPAADTPTTWADGHDAINPRAFKLAMRAVAGPVTILASEHDEIGFWGITATAVLVSPHAAHYSTQSYAEVRNKVFADVASVLRGGKPLYPVNRI